MARTRRSALGAEEEEAGRDREAVFWSLKMLTADRSVLSVSAL